MKKLPDFIGSKYSIEDLKAYVEKYGYADAVMCTPINHGAYDTIQLMLDKSYKDGGDKELGIALVNAADAVDKTIEAMGPEKSRDALIGFAVTAVYLGWACERQYRKDDDTSTHAHSEPEPETREK